MSDGDRFDALGDLDDSGDDEDEQEVEEDTVADAREQEVETPTPTEDTSERSDSGDSTDDEGDIQSKAFPYADAKQSPIYARPEAWDEYEDTLELDVERELRDRGVRNAQKRELNEAMLRVAAENPDLIVEKFLEIRREG